MSQVIQFELDDRELTQLRDAAERAGVSPQQFAQATVRQAIDPACDEAFEKIVSRMLDKNRELYRRLAQ